MAFWGVEVKPGKPFTYTPDNNSKGRLHISHATLGIVPSAPPEGIVLLQCNIGAKSPIFLCALSSNTSLCYSFNIELIEDEDVIFSVIGPCSVHIVGYYLNPSSHGEETEPLGEDIGAESDKEKSFDEGEDTYEDSFIDDDEPEVFYSEESEDDKRKCNKTKRSHRKRRLSVLSDDDSESKERIITRKKKKSGLEDEASNLRDGQTSNLKKRKKKLALNGAHETDEVNGLKVGSEIEDSDLKATIEGELEIENLKSEREGKVAMSGRKVKINYSVKIKESGEIIECNHKKKIRLGKGVMMKELEMGIEGMKVGEKRKMKVQSSIGYCEHLNVPPNTWLIYEIHLLKVC